MTVPDDGAEWFNRLAPDDAQELLLACCGSPSWAARLLEGRPYPNGVALLDAARTACEGLTPAEVDAALVEHPRIGQRPEGGGLSASWSRQEQAGVDAAAGALLASANAAYELRFGRVFLVAARDLSAVDVLAELDRRLGNDPDTEHAEVVGALGDIAVQRLGAALRVGADSQGETE